jgi:metal-responsive CopG/Arc/MetJ family transcriptional regulator
MKRIVVNLDDGQKNRLDRLRRKGYTINGFVKAAIEQALQDEEGSKKKGA